MYSILYIGNSSNFELEKLNKNGAFNKLDISFSRFDNIEQSMDILSSGNPIVSLIIEEKIEGLEEFILELRSDELYKYLPIIVIFDSITTEKRKKFYSLEIQAFLEKNFNIDELSLILMIYIQNKIRLEESLINLRQTYESNIKKSIQLDLLKKFISKTTWNKVETLAKGQKLKIEEEEYNLATLFCEIEIDSSKDNTPKKVIQTLNNVFVIATQVIYHNFGDIDKFIGESFFAIFEHPDMAILSSILIMEELTAYNMLREMRGLENINIRIGINYGKVIRGSVGGKLRSDNTLIGDTVNTAQRIKSSAKFGEILCSKELISNSNYFNPNNFDFKKINLKGKNIIIDVVSIFDYFLNDRLILDRLYDERLKIEKSHGA